MNKSDCVREKISNRAIRFLVVVFALLLTLVTTVFFPFFGLIFALPIFILGGIFLFAPESKVCRLLIKDPG